MHKGKTTLAQRVSHAIGANAYCASVSKDCIRGTTHGVGNRPWVDGCFSHTYKGAQWHFASVDSVLWKIVDGKPYLKYYASVQKKWENAMVVPVRNADWKWPAVLGQ